MRHLYAIVLCSFMFGQTTARALDVFVQPVEFRGAIAEDADVTTDLLRNAVDRTKGFNSVENGAKAQLTLSGRLLKLGTAYLLTIKRSDGARPAAELKVANMEDMHVATQRVARQVLVGGAEAPQVGEVTDADVRGDDRRVQAVRQWQFGFGPAWTTNLGDPAPASVWSLGFIWGIEKDYEIQLQGEFLSSTKSSDTSYSGLSVGMNYLFTRTRHSPFASVEFGYGSAEADQTCHSGSCGPNNRDDDKASGWQLGLGGGYKFFRTANINLAVAARYQFMMATTRGGVPSKTTIKVLLYF